MNNISFRIELIKKEHVKKKSTIILSFGRSGLLIHNVEKVKTRLLKLKSNVEKVKREKKERERSKSRVRYFHYSINFDTWLQLLFKILAIAFERF